jgi:hypothetical protein
MTQLARRASLVASVLLLLASVGTASAQLSDDIERTRRMLMPSAVDRCVAEAKRESPFSRFDAYVTSDGTIRMIGEEESKYFFLKCLDIAGYPLEGRTR